MVYTDLEALHGLWEPTDYGSGVEYADGALNLFPAQNQKNHQTQLSAAGLQIGLWLGGSKGCFSISSGKIASMRMVSCAIKFTLVRGVMNFKGSASSSLSPNVPS